MGDVVSVFLYLLQVPSYGVINDVIMSDADCTPGREPRSVQPLVTNKNLRQFHADQLASETAGSTAVDNVSMLTVPVVQVN